MKNIRFSSRKNKVLEQERGVSFYDLIDAVQEDRILALIDHPNQKKFSHQKLFVVEIKGCVYIVPFVETDEEIFLKTIYPSRRHHKKYGKFIKNSKKNA